MIEKWVHMLHAINTTKSIFFSRNFIATSISGINLDSCMFLCSYAIMLFLIFMVGAYFCGFFQCMIYRYDKNLDLWITRSFCDTCGKTLKWIDPVPFINYLVLHGKCRYCKTTIPTIYFLSEMVSGCIMLALAASPLHIVLAVPCALISIYALSYTLYFKRNNQ